MMIHAKKSGFCKQYITEISGVSLSLRHCTVTQGIHHVPFIIDITLSTCLNQQSLAS